MTRAACATTLLMLLAMPCAASAAPTAAEVRIEGYERTLFEGPVRGDGHQIRATSDTVDRRCDATNNGMNASPTATPTSLSVDAMTLIGETFDGEWYPGFDDYFIERFGPDAQVEDEYFYWGILVNDAFSSVGGCQFAVSDGDRVLWVANAFNARPLLGLTAPGVSGWKQGQVVTAALGTPVTVKVKSLLGAMDGGPQDEQPVAGVKVAPVAASAPQWIQTVLVDDPSAVVTDADGEATLTFNTPGWKRVKAQADGYVRSNRIDICVPAAGASGCGQLPADVATRGLPEQPPVATTTTTTTTTTTVPTTPTVPPPVTATGPVRIKAPSAKVAGNKATVSWAIADTGPGVKSWVVESRALAGNARWARRASGTSATVAKFKLPAGFVHGLRLTVTDALGNSSTASSGRVTVLKKLARGRSGQTVTLTAGKPLIRLRNVRRGTVVSVTAAGKTKRYSVSAGKLRDVIGARRSKAGKVQLKFVSGGATVDGAAAAP